MPERRRPLRSRLAGLRASRTYGFVLLLIVATFLFTATAPDADWSKGVLVLLVSGTLMMALWTSRAAPLRYRRAVLAAGAVIAVVEWRAGGEVFTGVSALLGALFIVVTSVVIGRGVVRQNAVNLQSVLGAVCIYLLIGMAFVFVDGAIAALGSDPFFAQGTDGDLALRLYFSFVTLTTVGYGDYTAAGDLARTLAVVEALMGQLYLVTVVSIVVGRLRTRPRATG